MKKFIVDQAFWDLFPEAEINIIIAKGMDGRIKEDKLDDYQALLNSGKEAGKAFLTLETFSQNDVIQEWREAFRLFKTKKGARSSIEALLKRVNQDRDFNPIIPLVDVYNSVSMKYAVPCGGEDISAIEGDMHLGMAKGGESFFPLGAEKDEPALEGEICYFDEVGAICRCFNWREAQRTMLQEETVDAVLVIEAINEGQAQRARQAIEELKVLINQEFGIEGQLVRITPDSPEAVLED